MTTIHAVSFSCRKFSRDPNDLLKDLQILIHTIPSLKDCEDHFRRCHLVLVILAVVVKIIDTKTGETRTQDLLSLVLTILRYPVISSLSIAKFSRITLSSQKHLTFHHGGKAIREEE